LKISNLCRVTVWFFKITDEISIKYLMKIRIGIKHLKALRI